MMDSTSLISHVPESAFPVVTGCVAFGTTLALSTLAQKLVGISTGTKIVPTVAGMATVALASLASQQMAVYNHQYLQSQYYNPSKRPFLHSKHQRQPLLVATSGRRDYLEVASLKIPLDELRVCVLGLITFRLLGGRFWGVAPSSYTQVGSFSRWSIPCGEAYASPTQRAMVERMGAKWGCHTCGSRMLRYTKGNFKFVADHMPPKSVAEQMNATWIRKYLLGKVPFRFYPQCVDCSNAQGSILSKAQQSTSRLLPSFQRAAKLSQAGGGTTAHYHGLRPRINHLTGGVLAGITVVGATDRQIQTGNRGRFQDWQGRVQGWIRDVEKKLPHR